MVNTWMVAALETMWRKNAPALRKHPDTLALVAFRLLVYFLEMDDFFLRSAQEIVEIKISCVLPREFHPIVHRTDDPDQIDDFISAVSSLLATPNAISIAQVVFALDEVLGKNLAAGLLRMHIAGGMGAHIPKEVDAINLANRILLRTLRLDRVVLLRPSKPYWKPRRNTIPPFYRGPQHLTCRFGYLLPGKIGLSALDYSYLERPSHSRTKQCIVALWPVKIKSINSCFDTLPGDDGETLFRFKRWENLGEDVKTEHEALVNKISTYIAEAQDTSDRIYIVAAPELVLAPQSLAEIGAAAASRRDSNWIIFPGTYHIDHGKDVINIGSIFVGGKLDEMYLAQGSQGPISAIKRTPFVVPYDGTMMIENIIGTASSVHVLDTAAGRLAVMICRDFLEEDVRHEIALLGLDHLFVLSMSPDTGKKFTTAMDAVSDLGVASFFVNAGFDAPGFPAERIYAAFRKPIRHHEIEMYKELSNPQGQPYVFTLELSDGFTSGDL